MADLGDIDFADDSRFAGLIVFGWDLYEDEPVAAITQEPWDLLDNDRIRQVWQTVAEVALEFCSRFGIPDTVGEAFPEN